MNKTLKQIADELGVSKQKVYRVVIKNHINEVHQSDVKNETVKYYDEVAQNLIKSALYQKTVSEKPHQSDVKNETVNDTLMWFVKEQLSKKDEEIAYLRNELDIKNKQIESLNQSLDQAQQLHAMAESKVKLLECKEEPKGFFARLFNK